MARSRRTGAAEPSAITLVTPPRGRWVIVAVLALAFLLRALPAHVDATFEDGAVVFATQDALAHARHAESIVAHFPLWSTVDPYLQPEGARVPVAPMLALLAGLLALPSGSLDAIAAWLPPVLGTAGVWMLYLLVRRWRDQTDALLAAFLLAILPGQYLQRSRIGYFDHHVLEVLLLVAVLVFLVRAQQLARRKDAVLAGACLAAYCLAWSSAALGVAILLFAAIVVFVSGARLEAFAGMFAVATMLVAPVATHLPRGPSTLLFLVGASLLTGTAVVAISRFANRTAAILVTLSVAGVGGLLLLALAPRAAGMLRVYAHLLLVGGLSGTITEGQSLLRGDGVLLAWQELGLLILAAPAGLWIVIREWRRERSSAHLIILVPALGFVAAALLQRRFLSYAAAFAATLAAIALSRWPRAWRLGGVVAIVLVAAASPYWRTAPSTDMTPSFREAMRFLRERTAEPFGDGAVYLTRFTNLMEAPKARSSVLSWWDDGYAIARAARRVPVAIPTQAGARPAAAFLLAQDEEGAEPIAKRLRVGHVVVDTRFLLFRPTGDASRAGGWIAQIAAWNREPASRYFEQVLYMPPGERERMVYVFHPEYYRSMAARLILFGGQAAAADYLVATFESAGRVKRIVELRRYERYRDAMNAVLRDPSRSRRLIGIDPLQSCVPVEPLQGYREVFASTERDPDAAGRPRVRIFERVDGR